MFVVELVEGNAHTCQAVPLDFYELGGNNLVLLLRKMKIYFATGRCVIVDSDFCVLKGLIYFRNKFVFACSDIKKRRYWPYMVPGK